jgi:glutaredoxin
MRRHPGREHGEHPRGRHPAGRHPAGRHPASWRLAAAILGLALLVIAEVAAAQAPALPYELARAARMAPVLLYTTARCDACDQGRALLRERGVPFTEYTVNTADDEKQLHQVSGGKSELPLLLVGKRKITGFQAAAWQEALSSAAYPRQTSLPPGYQYAAPQPAGTSSSPTSAASAPSAPVRAQLKMPPDEAAAQAAEQQPRAKAGDKPAPSGSGIPEIQ